jgi:diaminohydroxyphosphoribosylaminopyrimidine deaminase/5-amino-6-(5-phosphoribosylamino)uracil reductase
MPQGWNNKNIGFAIRVVQLAERGRGRVSPNPLVGALIVKNGKIIAEGFHAKFGGPHAEVVALRKAGLRAKGATLYSSLEPCTIQGKTPPCTSAIIRSGIRRVIYLAKDPNPAVHGKAERILRKAGVLCEYRHYPLEYLNQGFSVWVRKHRPRVVLKAAVSLDGRIADYRGSSRGLGTGNQLRLAHTLRMQSDAILVGAGTLLADDPKLTVRMRLSHPRLIRVILDRSLRIPSNMKIFSTLRDGPVWIVADPAAANSSRADRLRRAGAEIIALQDGGQGYIAALLKLLGKRGVTSLLVEGGARVHGRFLQEGYCDFFWIMQMPLFLGEQGVPLVKIGKVKLSTAPRVRFFQGMKFRTVACQFKNGVN